MTTKKTKIQFLKQSKKNKKILKKKKEKEKEKNDFG